MSARFVDTVTEREKILKELALKERDTSVVKATEAQSLKEENLTLSELIKHYKAEIETLRGILVDLRSHVIIDESKVQIHTGITGLRLQIALRR